jgi:hypothetical protein
MARSKQNSRLPALLAPLGLLIFVGFALGSVFFGFSRLIVVCERAQSAQPPSCEATDRRLFGVYTHRVAAPNVTAIRYMTQNVNTASRTTLGSTVVLVGSSGEVPVSAVVTSFGEDWKPELIRQMQTYLDSPNESSFRYESSEQTVFGWIGAAILIVLTWSVASWLLAVLCGKPSR